MGALVRAHDWSRSPLGRPEDWPASLKTTIGLILPAQAQIVLFWGPNYVALYNDAYAPTIGDKHPRAFGRPAIENWAELWDDLEPLLRGVRETGETFVAKDRCFFIERHGGVREEVFFDMSFSAVPDGVGGIGGVLCIVSETTERVQAERRQSFLLRLGDATRRLGEADAVIAATTRLLGERLTATRVAYAEIDEASDRGTVRGDWTDGTAVHLPEQVRLSDFGASLIDWLRTGETLVADSIDAHAATRASTAALQGIGARAIVSVPLIKDGRFVANLNVHQATPRPWTRDEVRLIEEVAERTWESVERVRVEAARRTSEEELVRLTDALPVLVSYLDESARYRFVNKTYEEWFGHSREEIRGRHMREVLGDAAFEQLKPAVERVLRGERFSLEARLPYKDGGARDVHVEYVPRVEEGGAAVGWYALVQDIGDRVRTEAALRESEARLHAVVEQASTGIAQTDLEGRFVEVNDRYCALVGRSRQELLELRMQDITHPDDLAANMPRFKAVAAGGPAFEIEKRYVRPDGSQIWVRNNVYGLRGASGQVENIVAVSSDLTDRRAAEAALRESEDRFRNMADHAPVMMWVTNESGACTYLNRGWYEFTGQTEAEAEGFGWLEATHPDDKAEAERVFLEANAAQRPFRLEYRLRRADGVYRWAIDAASPRFGSGGEFLGYVGSVIDIDERRGSEVALAVNEERLRLATDAAELGFWDVDVVNDLLIWPPRVKAMFGISADVPVTMADFYEGLHPQDREVTAAAFEAACDPEQRALYDVEYRTVGKEDGVIRWVAAKGRALFSEDGRCLRVVGTAIDVTRRKLADEALRESEGRLRFFAELDESLRASRDAPEAMLAAASVLAHRLDVTRCAYADVDTDEENDRFVIRSDWTKPGVPSSAGTYSLDLFGPRAVANMKEGRTLVVRDVGRELAPGEGREMFQSIQIDAIICCPLIRHGRLAAMMAVHEDKARDWTEEEIGLVEAVVERCWAHVERVGAEARLRESEERYRTLFTSIESGFCVAEVREDQGRFDYRVVEANPAFYRQTGFPETILGAWLREAAPNLEEHWFETYGRVGFTGEPQRFEQGSDMLGRWFDVYAFRVGDPEERRVAILFNDISARRNAELALRDLNETLEARVTARTAELESAHEQLRQSQKMEAMGQLTGGVAHDFNNLLTPIVGTLDMLQRKGLGGEREQRLIDGAVQSADRAKMLVQRLLAFARRQPLQTSAVDVAALTRGMADLIASTTGPQIKVVVDADDALPAAAADPNQLEMAILNLAVNARDAMPDGGTLRISVGAQRVGSGDTRLRPGDYVRLSVADTGVGMDQATLQRAIEPFFSTKGIGKGTGLGLSMVHGLASQLGGTLLIHSQLGVGTNVEFWLPASAQAVESAAPIELTQASGKPKGTALLVDDEELVRASTADMLAELGHTVVEADSAEAALRLIEQGLRPDLLVTDHLMPGMTGTELARSLRMRLPDTAVLVVSGYADADGIAPDLPRLTKPFGSAELAAALEAVTDGRG
jgi:PAS domain S-box-containing protein